MSFRSVDFSPDKKRRETIIILVLWKLTHPLFGSRSFLCSSYFRLFFQFFLRNIKGNDSALCKLWNQSFADREPTCSRFYGSNIMTEISFETISQGKERIQVPSGIKLPSSKAHYDTPPHVTPALSRATEFRDRRAATTACVYCASNFSSPALWRKNSSHQLFENVVSF